MARARNIKPGFFANDTLAECSPLARLLFAGLWTIADRAGRLEDRPKRIKAALLPYDECDVNDLLDQLVSRGFIARYEVGGQKLIQVLAFNKHQNPHKNEPESLLSPMVDEREPKNTDSEQEPKQHSTSTVQEPEQHSTDRADSLNLIPDSSIPVPDGTESSTADAADARSPSCPHAKLLELFGKHLPGMPQPRAELWAGKRSRDMRDRWRWVLTAKKPSGARYAETPEEAIDFFDRFFAYVAQSDFLTGRNGKWHGCTLAWLMDATNFAKVIEGTYNHEEVRAAA